MTPFAVNLLLALSWAFLRGDFSLASLLVGFVIGFAALWATRPLHGETGYIRGAPRGIGLALFFLGDLVASSVRVLIEVLTPVSRARPGIVAVPLAVRSDLEILALANMITLTPGTLSLDLSDDCRTLYVHCMFLGERGGDAVVDGLRHDLEDRIRRIGA